MNVETAALRMWSAATVLLLVSRVADSSLPTMEALQRGEHVRGG